MNSGSFSNAGPRTQLVGGIALDGQRKIGQKVINKTGSDIATDTVVAISGFDVTTQLPKVSPADGDFAGQPNIFITAKPIANGAQGYVYKGGLSAANLDTSGVTTVGDAVYLSATAGGFTAANGLFNNSGIQRVGWTVVKSSTVGQILWQIDERPSRAGQPYNLRARFTVAQVNAGATIVVAPGSGYKLRLVDYIIIAVGGAVGAATGIYINATQAAGTVHLAAIATAALTQSAVNRPGASNNVVLADGASFVANDADTAITILKNGSDITTATNIDVILSYAADPV